MTVMGITNTGFKSAKTKAAMKAANPEEFGGDLGGGRYHVEREIYVFSTARKDFKVNQTLFPDLLLKGCHNGERYVLSTPVADPVPQVSQDLERGGRRWDYHDGWQSAVKMLNPEAPSPDQWIGAEGSNESEGNNLYSQGLFVSLTNPPAEEDLKRAEGIRNRRYKRLTDQAFRAAAKSSRALSDFLRQHEDVADAMDAQGLTADWHQKQIVRATCPNCGDSIPSSVAFHLSSTGILCVIDPERAFKAGAIDRARMEDLMLARA